MIWLAAAIVVTGWVYCGLRAYKAVLRTAFWKWPGIWKPGDWRDLAIITGLLGPVGVVLVRLEEGRVGWPPIPGRAYEMDREWPDYADLDRFVAFKKEFEVASRAVLRRL